jgi:hypothetical protein
VSQDPLSNRACGFPAHGLPMASRTAALRKTPNRCRITHRATETVKTKAIESLRRPTLHLARSKVTPLTRAAQAEQPPPDVQINRVETPRGIPGTKVSPPTTQHRTQVTNHAPDVLMAPTPRGQLPNALPDPLHRTPRRPPIQEVHAPTTTLPNPTRHALPQMTTKEIETLPTIEEVDHPRLLRVQLQTQARHDLPNPRPGPLTIPA